MKLSSSSVISSESTLDLKRILDPALYCSRNGPESLPFVNGLLATDLKEPLKEEVLLSVKRELKEALLVLEPSLMSELLCVALSMVLR